MHVWNVNVVNDKLIHRMAGKCGRLERAHNKSFNGGKRRL